ncbi:hypothetical protein B296_00031375 [Ensete ventricosum]|uniref:Uncharacterized protein n=1 Tax=Ensete ventricosum TaxID=4639 RepID=A0A426YMK4_ENSVE|nr:hypothetical protein B296_00031375 [Ensete ventricosum]
MRTRLKRSHPPGATAVSGCWLGDATPATAPVLLLHASGVPLRHAWAAGPDGDGRVPGRLDSETPNGCPAAAMMRKKKVPGDCKNLTVYFPPSLPRGTRET